MRKNELFLFIFMPPYSEHPFEQRTIAAFCGIERRDIRFHPRPARFGVGQWYRFICFLTAIVLSTLVNPPYSALPESTVPENPGPDLRKAWQTLLT
ncbi:hypothetical protein [Geobacter argillaceus]|uniref:hypothetical protein n=1 Tax=Geobacter argillaceus TaxID=345631 RepID=UPI0011A31894|nr:hypothetical protein [Geobacter argillaceus]